MGAIEFRNFFCYYRHKKELTPALKEITLSVEYGEFVSLVGPSGSGKTTLLKAYYQQYKPTVLFVTHDLQEAETLASRVIELADGILVSREAALEKSSFDGLADLSVYCAAALCAYLSTASDR